MSDNITYYSKHAERLTAQYNSVSFEQVHEDWLDEIPQQGFALDIGAGSGRDARYLASRGLSVVAVEPAGGIRERAQHYAVNQPVHWLDDSLPELKKVFNLSARFDLILLSAVWMHIVPSERERCLRKVSGLLKANGKIVISLRHGGAVDDGRTMYPVSADELSALAKRFGLTFRLLSKKAKPDELGRSNVTWETVVLTLPDDGSGAFPLLRNIIVNDSKSSTYKVALLRTLLRIAEGHPGAVIDRTDGYVVLPAGLVALYWIRLFKPLLDHFNLPQNSVPAKKPGFLKEDGWEKLASFSGNDLYVGANFSDPLSARAVHRTIKDVATVIRDMPARYITLPGTKDNVFHVTLNHPRIKDNLSLDGAYFASVGKFYVPERIWDSLSRFSVWIEPSLVNEWVALMESYMTRQNRTVSKGDLLRALSWEDPVRTTARVRGRVDKLLTQEEVKCCWSRKAIRINSYAVDHAMPFARWPNNDLWNLLPAQSKINAEKSDKLPTSLRMMNSRHVITGWWEQAWQAQADEFFIQANLSLPNLSAANRSFSDVFEAMVMQRDRIKDFQQLKEW